MKATQAILAMVAGLATYKILSTFRYTIPEQEPPKKIAGESQAAKLPAGESSAVSLPSGQHSVDCPCCPCLDAADPVILPPVDIFSDLTKAVGLRSSDEIPKFNLLRKTSQDVLLRNFASDYTSPRMTISDEVYDDCVNAANFSGAPCGWVQFVAQFCSDTQNLHMASDAMLSYFDDNIDGCESLQSLRSDTISIGILAAKGPFKG